MGNPTKKLKKADIEAQQPLEKPISARGLEGAYSDDEPEYTLDALVAVNPDYKGTREACNAIVPIPARGLEGAYSDDEPEYTLDMLVAVNPDYKGTREACNTTARAPACSDEPKSTIKRKERNERA
ncbi:hypothetical protein F4055_06400 [Candidatus Poribacteria bacterium]|nr:hypothetical protein [Candidatus Poribacteria bacterium]